MTCKDCIHSEVCLDVCGFMSFELKGMGGDCEHFADKSLYIKLPCKVGDTVYQTDGIRIYESTICEITFTKRKTIYVTESIVFDERAIGTSVFLTREKVEAALEGREK